MNSNYFTDPIVFLIQTIFNMYTLALLLRFLLQWVRADFYNPISQFIVKITNPPLLPLRRIIPGLGGVDIASLLLALLTTAIKYSLLILLAGSALSGKTLIFLSLADLIDLLLSVFFFTIIVHIIISWVAPQQHNYATVLLAQLTDPLLRPARRIIPLIGGLDLSPMIVIILIQLSKMILLPPLHSLAY